jgi:hypothetical protein
MQQSTTQRGTSRRSFVHGGLLCGTILGLGCPYELLAQPSEEHKFQSPTTHTYEQLYAFAFGSWFISYMKQLQEQVGEEEFLAMLRRAGDEHYISSLQSFFSKANDRSLVSFIENFWEATQRSTFGRAAMTIEIPEKTADRSVVRVNECLFATTFRENDGAEIGYAAICNADHACIREFNPEIQLTRNLCLMQGDECCLFEYAAQAF